MWNPRVVSLAALAAVILGGCVAAPTGGPALGQAPAVQATLRLRLADAFGGKRQLFALTAPVARVRVTVQSQRGALLRDEAVEPVDGQVTLSGLPVASGVLVSLQGVATDDLPVAGALERTVGVLRTGENTLRLSPEANLAGAIVVELLARDARGATVTQGVDFEGLTELVSSWQAELGAPDASLLSASAIGAAWHAEGAPPVAEPGFYPKPGRIVLRPDGWPTGVPAVVALSAPTFGRTWMYGSTTVLEPVPPGTWTLVVEPSVPGLSPARQDVGVAAGQTVDLPISFGHHALGGDLDRGRGGAAFGVVPTGLTSSALLVAGGVLAEVAVTEPIGPTAATSVIHVPAADAPATPVAPLAQGVVFPASAAHEGKVYVFGGRTDTGLVGTTTRLDPRTGQRAALAPLPGGVVLAGSAAASLGGLIHVVGGLDVTGEATRAVFTYDPARDTWATNSLPPLPDARMFAAAAVLDGTLYVLGGGSYEWRGLPIAEEPPLAIRPGIDPTWRELPAPPTARLGAGAVAADGRVWLIGGAIQSFDSYGPVARLSNAVEAFDPQRGEWSVRQPLREARSFPAVGLVEGTIVVAGGLLATAFTLDLALPVATVERIQP